MATDSGFFRPVTKGAGGFSAAKAVDARNRDVRAREIIFIMGWEILRGDGEEEILNGFGSYRAKPVLRKKKLIEQEVTEIAEKKFFSRLSSLYPLHSNR